MKKIYLLFLVKLFFFMTNSLNAQQNINLTGRLEKGHFDLKDGSIENVFYITTPSKVFRLKEIELLKNFHSGDKVKISVTLSDELVEIESITLSESNLSEESIKSFNKNYGITNSSDIIKAVIIPFYFSDGLSSSGDKIELLNKLFDEELTNQYFQKVSYGKIKFSRTSCNPVLLNKPAYQGPLTNDDLKILIDSCKIDIRNYNRIVLVTWNTYPFNGFALGSYIDEDNNSYSTIYISEPYQMWTPNDINLVLNTTLIHEFGHTLGCYHAGGYEVETGRFTYTYGNWFDMMGRRYCGLDFNLFFKENMKWLDSTSIITINKTGTYTINWLGKKSGVRGAKILDQLTNTYNVYIEYRKAKEVDSVLATVPPTIVYPLLSKYIKNTEGIMVNVLPGHIGSQFDADTYLLDLAPNDSVEHNWDVVTLNGNNTYNIGKGITLGPILSFNDSSITFNVRIDKLKIEDGLIAHYPLEINVRDTLGISPPFATLNTSFADSGGLYCNGKPPQYSDLLYAYGPFGRDTVASYAQTSWLKQSFFFNYAIGLDFKCEETLKRTIVFGMQPGFEFGVCINEQNLLSLSLRKGLVINNTFIDTVLSIVTNYKIEKDKWYQLLLTHGKSTMIARLFVNDSLILDQIVEPEIWPYDDWRNVLGIHPYSLIWKYKYLPFQGWIKNFKLFSFSNNTAIEELKESISYHNYELFQNYPNPFNPTTIIKYSIPQKSFVALQIYNLLGQEITRLVNEEKQPGSYEAIFDGSKLSSGIYLYKLQTGKYSETKKLLLIK